MNRPKKKFVEYFGNETAWLNLWAIQSYLFANRFLRVIFFSHFVPFGGAALGEMYNSTDCSGNMMAQSLFFSIWPSWILGGASAAISRVVVVLSCLWLFFSWWPERVGRRAGCRCVEPWESPLQRGIVNLGSTGVPQVTDEAEKVHCRFKSRLRRLKGILAPLLCHAVPETVPLPL